MLDFGVIIGYTLHSSSKGITMRTIIKTVGVFDRYRHGRVAHIDFTYNDHIVVWVQYKRITKAYLYRGHKLCTI